MTQSKLSLCLLAILLAGCGSDESAPVSLGERLFNDTCAECHKVSGKGNFIAGIPANVTTGLDREGIIKLITQGLPAYPDMPSFPHLSREEAGAVADHLSSLAQAEE